ncbi:MAG: ABC transporter substrate-binding protein [Pseudobdellovibrionaceae bacterium]
MSANSMTSSVKKYGYVPLTFPRDPAEVNLFSEHIVLGQILEPVVDTDKFGNVTPGIAESWTFEDKGLTIRLKIRRDRQFSNGKKITAKDVKYTITRMIEKKSQSSNFLNSVSEITAPDFETLIIHLKEPNVAILKALSRDQLGIMPEGWTFDKNASEPFVGSGPYLLRKEGLNWYLVENEKYQGTQKPTVKKWQLIYSADQDGNIPISVLPDYAPAITSFAKRSLEKIGDAKRLKTVEQLSFAQTSAWWHPSGEHFSSLKFRSRAMQLAEEIMDEGTKKIKLERATGVIPKGVSGHLAEHPQISKIPIVTSKALDHLRLGVVGSIFDELMAAINLSEIAKKHGFTLEVVKIPPSEMKNIGDKKIDVILAGWAGGFNDPEGFIALLPTYLGKDFMTYIGPNLAETYKKARLEQDWTARSEMFKKVNAGLRESQLMVPGWKIPFYIAGQASLISEEATFRYTPRLQVVKEGN